MESEEGLIGVDAVIDKDLSSSLLALDIHADMLVILTAVEKVCIHFGKENEEALSSLSIEEAKQYALEGHFAAGSMLPKIEAAIDFVEKTKATALITSLDKAKEALEGKTGTHIHI